MKKKKLFYWFVLWIIFLFFLISIGSILISLYTLNENKKETEALALVVAQIQNSGAEEEIFKAYRDLATENEDMVGWISIDDTPLNYPIMQTKDDPEFYLRRDFKKGYSVSGMIFADSICSLSTNNVQGNNIILYGHNMVDNTMFGIIDDYLSQEFMDAHPIIYLDTLQSRNQYRVVAAFKIDTAIEEECELIYSSHLDEQKISKLKELILEESICFSDTEIGNSDNFLMLSTCDNNSPNTNERIILLAIEQ